MARQKKSETVTEAAEEETRVETEPGALDVEVRRAEIHVDRLVRSPLNPRVIRGEHDETKIEQLAASIRHKGVLDDLLVRSSPNGDVYEILAGDSRWRAIQQAMVEVPARAMVPCKVYPASLPDDQALEIAIESNDHRDDPHPLDQCAAFVTLRDQHGRSVEQIAARIGRSVPYVYDRLRLEQLTSAGREALIRGAITLSVALILARIGSPDAQDRTTTDLIKRFPTGVPIDAARAATKARLMVIAQAPFDVSADNLGAGPCDTCPKRSDVQRHLFGDLLLDDSVRCTDPECWDTKSTIAWTHARSQAELEGKHVAEGAEAKKIQPHTFGGLAGGYERLDDHCYLSTDGKSWREMLGTKIRDVQITVISDERGRPIDVAKRTEMESVLSVKRPASQPDAEELAQAFQRELGNEMRELVTVAIGKRVGAGKHATLKFHRAFASAIIRAAVFDGIGEEVLEAAKRRKLMEREGDDELKGMDADRAAEERLEDALAGMSLHHAFGLAAEILLGRALLHGPEIPKTPAGAVVEALGIDLKALRRDATKTVKARAASAAKAKRS